MATEIGELRARLTAESQELKTEIKATKQGFADLGEQGKKTAGDIGHLNTALSRIGDNKDQINRLTSVLENVNAKIDIQRKKLAEFKQSYETTFDSAKKSKLQEQIINTEATLLRLINTSDVTAQKIWDLEDSSNKAGSELEQLNQALKSIGLNSDQIGKINNAIKETNPQILEGQLKEIREQLRMIGLDAKQIDKIEKELKETSREAGTTKQRIDGLTSGLATLGAGAATMKLARTFKTLADEAQQLAMSYQGLTEVSKSLNLGTEKSIGLAEELSDRWGLSRTAMADTVKTYLTAGLTLEQTKEIMTATADAAVYNREAHLTWEEAIRQVAQGIKMGNSELTDAAGITTNLSVMYDRYAQSIGTTAAKLNDAQKIQAAYNGIMQESAMFAGNADSAMTGYTGTQATFNQTIETARVELGEAFLPVLQEIMETVTPMIKEFAEWASENKEVVAGIGAASIAFTSFIAVVGALSAAFIVLNSAMGGIGIILTVIGALAAGVTAYGLASDAAADSVLKLAESQEELNQKLNESPANRTVDDVKKLQGDIETLNEIVKQRIELEEKLNNLIENDPQAKSYANFGIGMDIKEVRDLKNEIADLDDKLQSMDFENVDEAAAALKRMRSEAEKSTPALMQMAKAELQDVAAKNSKIIEMEKMVGRYKQLAAMQKLDEAQKQELIQITNALKRQYPQLQAHLDKENRIRIENIGTISNQIGVEKSLLSTSVESAKGQITNIKNVTAVQKAAVEAQIKNYQQLANVMGQISGKMLKIGTTKGEGTAKRVGAMVTGLFAGGLAGKAQEEAAKKSEEQVKLAATEIEADRALANLTSGNFDTFAYKPPDFGGGGGGDTKKNKGKKGKGGGNKEGKSAAEIARDKRKEAYDAAMATARYNAEYYDQTAEEQLKALEKIKKNHKQHLAETLEDQRELNLQMKRLQEDSAKSNYEASATWIDRQERKMEESYKSEVQIGEMKVKAWTRVRDKYKKGSELYKDADEQLYRARTELVKAQFKASEEWIEKEERRMEESGKSEMQITQMKIAAWTRVRDRYHKDSEYYKQADEQLYRFRKDLIKLQEQAEKEVAEAREEQIKERKKQNDDLVKNTLKGIEKEKKAELDAIEERKKAYIDAQNEKIAAIDAQIKKEQELNADADYETLLAEKMARKEKLSTAVSPEGRKELADITAEIERMQLEHSRELRKRDLEDQKEKLEDEKNEKEKAFDDEKRAAEERYDALASAMEEHQDDIEFIENAIKEFRIGTNQEANDQILSDLDKFVSEYRNRMTEITALSAATGVTGAGPNSSQAALELAEYNANKDAWAAAKARGDKEEMARLVARNEEIRKRYGIKKDTGKLDQLPSFDVGGVVPGPIGAPMEAIIHGGEVIFNPGQFENMFRRLTAPVPSPALDRSSAPVQHIENHFDMSIERVEVQDATDAEIMYTERERTARRLATTGGKG